jgi:hypothetical protein
MTTPLKRSSHFLRGCLVSAGGPLTQNVESSMLDNGIHVYLLVKSDGVVEDPKHPSPKTNRKPQHGSAKPNLVRLGRSQA